MFVGKNFSLLQYVVEQGGKTLLPQYLGMYRLTLNNAEHYVIVIRNVLSSTLKTHKKYDLKVSMGVRYWLTFLRNV